MKIIDYLDNSGLKYSNKKPKWSAKDRALFDSATKQLKRFDAELLKRAINKFGEGRKKKVFIAYLDYLFIGKKKMPTSETPLPRVYRDSVV